MPKGGVRPGAGRPPAEHSRAKDRAAAKAERERTAASTSPSTSTSSSSTKDRAKPAVVELDGEWLLPREGRPGNPPAWPLSRASTRERELWRRQWKRPQALAWERLGLDEQVAVYVRTLARAEEPESAIGLSNLVRQFQDGLGLSAAGMRMLRWKIGQPPKTGATPAAEQSTPRPAPGVPPKQRLTVVRDGSGG